MKTVNKAEYITKKRIVDNLEEMIEQRYIEISDEEYSRIYNGIDTYNTAASNTMIPFSAAGITGIKVGASGSTIEPSNGVITIPAYETGAQVHIAPTTAEVKSALNTVTTSQGKYLKDDGTWDTPAVGSNYESKSAVENGTDVSLVTTGEKYAWNQKQDAITFNTAYNASTNKAATMSDITKANVGLSNVTNYAQVKASEKGVANGVAELDSNGKVPSSQLPAYVDDVLEYSSTSTFPSTGETGKIYVAIDTNKTYRWSGTEYTQIKGDLALGETSSTAYRGDRGKTAYDHSQSAHAPSDANKFDLSYASSKLTKTVNGSATDVVSASTIVTDGGGIKEVEAAAGSNIGSVGTPSVTASTSGNKTTFTFNYLKGAKGDNGSNGTNGTSAGFGTPTATVDANVGTPSVTITSSGPDTAKVFNFAFKNLKGQPGTNGTNGTNGTTPSVSATASVDANTGTPSVTVTKSGTDAAPSFAFAFKNLKGAAGQNATTTSVFSASANGLAPAASSNNKTTAESSQGNYYLCADGKYRQLPANAFNYRSLGTGANDACAGNDSRLSNSRPASDVYAWAKASTKPSYSYSEISGTPSSLPASDVYSWAKASTKPSYTLSEVGASMSVSAISSNTSSSCSITGSGNAGKSETIIYTNSGSSDLTVTVPTTYKTPDGAAIELTCKAGGYCEVSYLNIGGTIYARGL